MLEESKGRRRFMVEFLGLSGLALLASGCGGGDPNAVTVGQPTTKEEQDKERKAREAAYGAGKTTGGKKQAAQ